MAMRCRPDFSGRSLTRRLSGWSARRRSGWLRVRGALRRGGLRRRSGRLGRRKRLWCRRSVAAIQPCCDADRGNHNDHSASDA